LGQKPRFFHKRCYMRSYRYLLQLLKVLERSQVDKILCAREI
jgi:hypothetical protein